MDSLPVEILDAILLCTVRVCRCEKNNILSLRRVCKAFDEALKPIALQCLQLEFSRFRKFSSSYDLKSLGALRDIGKVADSLYLDLMVIRDEEEIERLMTVFQSLIPEVPEMTPLLESLRKYCMGEATFDETDYIMLVDNVLRSTPNMTRLKLNLPFQVVGQSSRTATLLLATTLATLRVRPEEYKVLTHLVLDHVSDTTLIDICNNPLDVANMMWVFRDLRHLILSIKRQESRYNRQAIFASNLWHLIEQATHLRSLCLIGWNVKRNIDSRVHVHGVQQQVWDMRSLPFLREGLSNKLPILQTLELKRVDMDPHALLSLLSQVSQSLRELYLCEVYLKVRPVPGSHSGNTSLWIGYPGIPRPTACCWLAEDLRKVDTFDLNILRVTGIGYDDFEASREPQEYDLKDPSGRNRSFDERFVQAVMKGPDPIIEETIQHLTEQPLAWPPIVSSSMASPWNSRPSSSSSATSAIVPRQPWTLEERIAQLEELRKRRSKRMEYDCETFQRTRNSTSWFKRCIDGNFFNHNEEALKELQKIISAADRGMTFLQSEMDRARNLHRYPDTVPSVSTGTQTVNTNVPAGLGEGAGAGGET